MKVDDVRHDGGPDDADRQQDRAVAGQGRDQAGGGLAGVRADPQQVVAEPGQHDQQAEPDGALERPEPLELDGQHGERGQRGRQPGRGQRDPEQQVQADGGADYLGQVGGHGDQFGL
jgi:hypothetical protein